MMHGWIIAAATLLAAPGAVTAAEPEDAIIDVRSGDPEMNAAKATAQASLGMFYARLAAPAAGEDEFMVKFDIDPTEEAEFVWATQLDRSAVPMTGVLINQPVQTDHRLGQRVHIREQDIIDWGYRSGGVMQGSFTNRVLIGRMSPEQAAEYRAFLGW